jgi:hypothetical protein
MRAPPCPCFCSSPKVPSPSAACSPARSSPSKSSACSSARSASSFPCPSPPPWPPPYSASTTPTATPATTTARYGRRRRRRWRRHGCHGASSEHATVTPERLRSRRTKVLTERFNERASRLRPLQSDECPSCRTSAGDWLFRPGRGASEHDPGSSPTEAPWQGRTAGDGNQRPRPGRHARTPVCTR